MKIGGIIDVTPGAVLDYDIKAAAITPATSNLNTVSSWFDAVGASSRSGEIVTEKKILSIPAAWQAIILISGDLAKLPIHLYRRDEQNGRQRLRSNPLEILVRKRPSDELTAMRFWTRYYTFLLLYGNSYAWIQRARDGRTPVALWPMLPALTTVFRSGGRTYYRTWLDNEQFTFPFEDVIVTERICINNEHGERMVKHARDSFGKALARSGYASDFFRSGGRVGGKLKIPQHFSKEAATQAIRGFKELYQVAGSAFSTYFAKDGLDYDESKFSLNDAQIVESERESNRDVARYFNLHPSKVGEEHKSAYSSKSEDNRDYLDTTLSPYLVMVVQELALKLFSPAVFKADELYFEHNTQRLLAMNPLQRADQITKLRQAEVISSNEARQQENLPPRPGGDDYTNPNTRSPAAEPTDESAVVAAHRELLRDYLQGTLTVASGKIARASRDIPDFQAAKSGLIRNAVAAVMQSTERVIRAHVAACGGDERAMSAVLRCAITELLEAATDGCKGEGRELKTSVEKSIKSAVDERLPELVDTIPEV